MEICLQDPRAPQVARLLDEHLQDMARLSPPESVHALDIEALCVPTITFWAAWEGTELLGCGALSDLGQRHGEVKSMRTAANHLRRGVAAAILRHIINEARRLAYCRLSLETGSMAAFLPAHALYAAFGFEACGPFANYRLDPNSVFMTRGL